MWFIFGWMYKWRDKIVKRIIILIHMRFVNVHYILKNSLYCRLTAFVILWQRWTLYIDNYQFQLPWIRWSGDVVSRDHRYVSHNVSCRIVVTLHGVYVNWLLRLCVLTLLEFFFVLFVKSQLDANKLQNTVILKDNMAVGYRSNSYQVHIEKP